MKIQHKPADSGAWAHARRTAGAAVAAALLILPAAAGAAALKYVETVMTGLANPRGLTIGPDGALYVAEAGSGGSGPSLISGDGFTVLNYGTSGAISRSLGGVQSQIATGLPSLAPDGGEQAHGVQDLAFGADGNLYATMGLGGNPLQLDDPAFDGLAGVDLVGTVAKFVNGTPEVFADIAQYEIDENPDGGNIDTNVYGIVPVGDGFIVTDAGGNSVLGVDSTGSNITTLAVLPDEPNQPGSPVPGDHQAVPTGAIAGPSGEFIFGQLTGFPFGIGDASVFSLTGGGLSQIASGFTMIIDVALTPGGELRVLELDSDGLVFGPGMTGSIFSVDSGGSKKLLASGLMNPTGIVVGDNGDVFVSVNGFSTTEGSVIRLAPVPLPATLPALASGLALLGLWRARRRPTAE